LKSLECDTRAEGVERLVELLEVRDGLRGYSEADGVAVAEFVQKYESLAKENELLQEQGRRQQAELEELIRIKRQLAEREDEVARLRRQLVASGTPAKAGADEYSAGKRRRGAEVLQLLRGEVDASRDAKILQRDHVSSGQCAPSMIEERWRTTTHQGAGNQGGGLMECGPRGESEVEKFSGEVDQGNHMARYLRYLALPEVRPYSGEDPAYRFSAFLESFVLKYPRDSWGDAELGVLWRSKLLGKAKMQYEALPERIREGSFSGLVEAMRQVCRAEWRHDRIGALGELKTLRKREGQGVADFCVELEQLTRRAHPHMDEVALDAERAQLLFEQLAHWGDSYHLMEALESENHAYDRLKQTALRIERRDLTLRRTG
uniref:CCHC-type domain-containing protein n=1 Tax=Heligmosomoides polygyrus TaxID=6339 RepID=A0A183FBU5_HELPZ